MKTIKKACVFTGMAVGAGFASGREISDFFLIYGESWKSGLIFGGVLFFLAVFAPSFIVRKKGITDYSGYLSEIMGRGEAVFTGWVSGLFFFVMFFAMISAAGTAAGQLFGLPYMAGVAAFIILCAPVLLNGIEAVERISVLLVPFLAAGIMLMAPPEGQTADSLSKTGGSVYISAVIYVSYNVIAAPPMVIGSERSSSLAEDLGTGLLCCIALTVMGIAAGNGILSVKGAESMEFPLAAVAESRGKMFEYCYMAVFIMALLTTAVCNGMAAVDFAREKFGMGRKAASLILLTAAIPLSKVSFSAFVSKIYPIFGLAGILQLSGTMICLLRIIKKK